MLTTPEVVTMAWDWTQPGTWGAAGEVLAGVSAAAAVILGSLEVRRWREQRATERRSEAAADALATLLSALDAYSSWIDEMRFWAEPSGDGDPPDPRMLNRAMPRGRTKGEAAGERLRATTAHALVHLERSEIRSLDAAQGVFWRIEKAWQTYERNDANDRLQPLRELAATLAELRREVEGLAESGANDLRPIARLRAGAVILPPGGGAAQSG